MNFATHPDTLAAEDAIADSVAYWDRLDAEQAEENLRKQFLLAASVGDVYTTAPFAPKVYDPTRPAIKRYPSVGEVLFDGFNYSKGPSLEGDVMSLLCRAAKGEDVKQLARDLLDGAAKQWARMAL